ncbi:MAG: hypothetical protein AB9836_07475 [Aminipila sp.]
MYFAKFSSSEKFKTYPPNTIEQLDKYFASLTRTSRNRIEVSDICTTLGIHYTIAEELVNLCVSERLLQKQFAIRCPNHDCEIILEIIPANEVYDFLSQKVDCPYCDKENLVITNEDISPIYKLLDKPVPPPCEIAQKKAETAIKNLNFDAWDENTIYDIFFCPNQDEYAELEQLYDIVKNGKFENSTAQGDSLNDLCIYLLDLIKAFKSDKTIRKRDNANQIDCTVHNSTRITASVFEEMGPTFYCECKQEKVGPVNTYYHKLRSILSLSDYKLGIIFSMLPATRPCRTIAKDIFLQDKIIIINITIDELKLVIFDSYNILKLIAEKIFMVKSDATTSGVLFK